MKAVLLIVALLALSACATDQREPHCAALIGGGEYCLQPTTAIAPFELTQKVDVRFRQRRETLIVEVEADADGIRFAGLTPFGHKLLQVGYDNRQATATLLPDSRLRPSLVIALLQLARWPSDAVRAGLQAPLTLEERADQRHIIYHDEATLTIDYLGDSPYRRMHLSLPAADIELDIENLQVSEP
ncbi:MAG: hypothetical protein H6R17_2055 [Proteobacteria bacterium]|nr:hypothetical protein [Pseudomonadota bacterium]